MPIKEEKKKVKEIQFVIFRLADEEFGAEIASVLEITRILDITRVPDAPGFIKGVINLRGQVIPVVDLARQFGLVTTGEPFGKARIIVIDAGGETIGMMVDEVPEVVRIPEDQIEPAPEMVQSAVSRDYIKGVGKIDKRLVVLLDLNKVLSQREIDTIKDKKLKNE